MKYFNRVLTSVMLLLTFVSGASAHNNPTFREDLLATIEIAAVAADDGTYSRAISLSWPKKTVQLVWHVIGDGNEKVRFSVSQDGKEVLSDVGHGDRTTRLKGDGIVITAIDGASAPLKITVSARVIDRSLKKK